MGILRQKGRCGKSGGVNEKNKKDIGSYGPPTELKRESSLDNKGDK